MEEDKVRVGIRGAAGLLGSRLAIAIAQSKDMELAVGIFKYDPTLQRLLDRYDFGGPLARSALPKKVYLDEPEDTIARLNSGSGFLRFHPVEQLDLGQTCDIVIDAAAPGMRHALQKQYQAFPGAVILQDGEYPRGRLISPPLVAPPQGGNKFRQGGCFLSGVVPVLAALRDVARSVRIHLVMQYDGRESDFLVTERVNTFRIADAYIPRMEDELKQLFPEMEIVVESVIQIPGMLHYAVSLEIETRSVILASTIIERLGSVPRVRVLPDSVMGTYDINLARVIDDRVPPILVFGGSLRVTPKGKATVLRLKLALYYRTLAVLPNIDAIRILARSADPLEAMGQTDKDMGFSP
ncbi:MAG: hypothetical protein HYS89_00250 [Candidatus Colwellbacteria bacterium]|nr:hypothetical protein [Candidatus Colwellbacteria bacterium]